MGLIDGPVGLGHSGLTSSHIRELCGNNCKCDQASGAAYLHGTYLGSIPGGKGGSIAPAICPQCTIEVRPVFAWATQGTDQKVLPKFFGRLGADGRIPHYQIIQGPMLIGGPGIVGQLHDFPDQFLGRSLKSLFL